MRDIEDPPRLVDSFETPLGLRRAIEGARGPHFSEGDVQILVRAVELRFGAGSSRLQRHHPTTDQRLRQKTGRHAWGWRLTSGKIVVVFCTLGLAGGSALGVREGGKPRDSSATGVERPLGDVPTATSASASAPVAPSTSAHDSANAAQAPHVELPDASTQLRMRSAELESHEEYDILREARAILHRDPARALALTAEHGRRFKRGMLVQERETIAIEALTLLGRQAEAEARFHRFRAHYPYSPYRNRLEAGTSRRVRPNP